MSSEDPSYYDPYIDDLALLFSLFDKEFDKPSIKSVYETSHDIKLSIDYLIGLLPTKRTMICKFFLMETCLLRNCPYLHDLYDCTTICRFWLKGSCSRDKQCIFWHSLDEFYERIPEEYYTDPLIVQEPIIEAAEPFWGDEPIIEPSIDDLDLHNLDNNLDFKIPTFSTIDADTEKKLEKIASLYPQLTLPFISNLYQYACNSDIPDLIRYLKANHSMNAIIPPVPNAFVGQRTVVNTGPDMWVSTGDTASAKYKDAREDAEYHARLRNTYYEQSQNAFRSGNSKQAKEFSDKGRFHDNEMKSIQFFILPIYLLELHDNAYQNIASTAVHSTSGGTMIDLHGLHVNEALDLLKMKLASLKNVDGYVDIVTGTGHHSFEESKLRPSVMDYISKYYKYEERGGKYGGTFRIWINR